MNGVGPNPVHLYTAHRLEAGSIETSTQKLYAEYGDFVTDIEEGFFESNSASASRAALDIAVDGLKSTVTQHGVYHLQYAQGLNRNRRYYEKHEEGYFDMARADMQAAGKPYEENNPYIPVDQR